MLNKRIFKTFLIPFGIISFSFFTNIGYAVETAPRISDREIIEKLAKLEEGQKQLSKRIDDLRSDINSRFEDINKRFDSRFDDINKRFDTFISIQQEMIKQ